MSRDDGCHKIGRSVRPTARATTLRCHLVWVIQTGDMVWLETYLHHAFAEYRRDGEWFDLPDWIVDELVSIEEVHDDDDLPEWIKERHHGYTTAYAEQLAARQKAAQKRAFMVHVPPDVLAALDAFIEQQPVRVKRQAVIRVAIQEYLAKEGFWPLAGK